jgi:hypothetical protein
MLIGISNARQISLICSRHKILWAWGFLLVITVGLVLGYFYTKSRPTNEFKVPIWLLLVPATFGILYAARQYSYSLQQLNTDNIEIQLSGMSKKDYLNYIIGDDRANQAFLSSATSATMLSGSNVLGPFLRADNR